MSKNNSIIINHILLSINTIDEYTMIIPKFDEPIIQELYFDAICFQLDMIGEKIKHLPAETKHKYPDVHWDQFVKLSDQLIHHYREIKEENIRHIISNELPLLKSQVENIVKDIS